MATVEAKVFAHHYKNDGTYNVKIRVFHKDKFRFIDTEHCVSKNQVKKHPENKTELIIKDPFINKLINAQLDDYRIAISSLGNRLKLFNSDELKNYLTKHDEDIDFIKFCNEYIKELKDGKKDKSAANFNTVKNSIIDFFKREKVMVDEINLDMLYDWERFLRTERIITRPNQYNEPITTIQQPLKDASIHNYMRDLRGLFNHARKRYNKKSLGIVRIEHYPFEEFKIVDAPETKKRNTQVSTIKDIRDCNLKSGSRAELARDLFMLSFYMCGVNAVDLFQIDESNIISGRLEYNRSKTKDKRKDNAFISIKIVEEAKPLLKKYINNLSQSYSTIGGLNKALSSGMKEVCKQVSADGITYYWARHTVGNLARNKCRMSKDDVALALNHVDHGRKTTDIYVDKDWSIVDELQMKVIGLLYD